MTPDHSREKLNEVCRRHAVSGLLLFGSTVKGTATPDSDLDVLVSFLSDAKPTFLSLARLARELEAVFGRPVDLVPEQGLKPLIRDEVLESAEVLYSA